MKVQNTIVISAPITTVFAVFCDLSGAVNRISAIEKIEILEGSDQLNIGTKWRETRTMFGKQATEVMWVTAFDQPSSYSVEAQSHGTKYKTTYTFSELGGKTTAQSTFIGTPVTISAKLMYFALILFKKATQKALQKDLEDLKQSIEKS